MRSLAEVVSEEDFAGTNESEYLETVLVAVPKCVLYSPYCELRADALARGRNLVKEWETSYERLSAMVVPRSSTCVTSPVSVENF